MPREKQIADAKRKIVAILNELPDHDARIEAFYGVTARISPDGGRPAGGRPEKGTIIHAVLEFIEVNGESRQCDIARAVGRPQTQLPPIVNHLMLRGFIRRTGKGTYDVVRDR